ASVPPAPSPPRPRPDPGAWTTLSGQIMLHGARTVRAYMRGHVMGTGLGGGSMASAGKDVPGGSAPANPRRANPPPLQRRVVSRLLGPGADEAAQRKLVYRIEDRQAVLVELNLPSGAIAEDMREQFRAVFHP